MTSLKSLTLEEFPLESSAVLPGVTGRGAQVCYRTYGQLSGAGDNCVLLFTYYTGTDLSYTPWMGRDRPLDPDRHFIVVINHFGGGVSSSPSTTGALVPGQFPQVSIGDNARAAKLVLDRLRVTRVVLVAGWSIGGMQSLEYAAQNPEQVGAVLALCSAARCAENNQVFLDSVSAALQADPSYAVADPQRPPLDGLDAFGRVYAGWAYCEAFYAEGHYREFGYDSPQNVLAGWGKEHQEHSAYDLMASLQMWRRADLGASRGGLEAGLGAVVAPTILMPSTSDAYFTLGENRAEVEHLPHGRLWELDSPLGHVAGRPGIRAAEQQQVDRALEGLLEESATE
ncbi:alpha/beta fold hydrolase [Nesterenkonia muleiensis]|uniref:alpha/beta fold hydrolase n=1 Tax=Nesterenkonia muleiensis TaxID=2282648 RepID=UPI000E75D281|nr:alpha/beta fold hydrolase [Nesterenkonia muleiensis]